MLHLLTIWFPLTPWALGGIMASFPVGGSESLDFTSPFMTSRQQVRGRVPPYSQVGWKSRFSARPLLAWMGICPQFWVFFSCGFWQNQKLLFKTLVFFFFLGCSFPVFWQQSVGFDGDFFFSFVCPRQCFQVVSFFSSKSGICKAKKKQQKNP